MDESWQVGAGHGQAGGGRQRPVMLQRTEGQLFRERVGFVVVCIIGVYCSMQLLVELKSILEPFFWALFLLMGLKPVVDALERNIEVCLTCAVGTSASSESKNYPLQPMQEAQDEVRRGELQGMLDPECADSDDLGGSSDEEFDVHLPRQTEARRASRAARQARIEQFSDTAVDGEGDSRAALRKTFARGLAVVIALAMALGALYGFGFLILDSARHMRDHWDVYRKGAQNLATESVGMMGWMFQRLPESVKVRYEAVTADVLKTAQDILYGLLGDLVNNISSLLLGGLVTLLYTLFWLCSPVPIDSSIDNMFRRFILFKTLACLGYGTCVGILLALLSIDLASVFALTTFVLNYVPEVGPFVAMVLPCPVILLDSRLESPIFTLLLAVLGQLALKFAFSNIIEVKLIESDKKLRMHPVMILLSVGIFGHIWGPTGMLLSVPLMALLKISLFSDLVPASYRDPILILIEGDKDAPLRHGLSKPTPQQRRGERSTRTSAPPGG